jgi:hypothetical protein
MDSNGYAKPGQMTNSIRFTIRLKIKNPVHETIDSSSGEEKILTT